MYLGSAVRPENMDGEWQAWHRQYESAGPLVQRLEAVRKLARDWLDRAPQRKLRAISLCAGDGRDLLEVLSTHPRGHEVAARLVDMDPALVAAGRERAARAELEDVEFVRGDAGLTRSFRGAVPADLILACGIFGNVSDDDIRSTVNHLRELCAPGATVIWTRGRFAPDLTPTIRRWFAQAGFEEIAFVTIPRSTASAAAHRLVARPKSFRPEVRLFTFLPAGERPADRAGKRAPTAHRSGP
jgi:SAM-dependent methyltransferase